MSYRYQLLQRQRNGSLWVSSEVFTGEIEQVKRAVNAGYLIGEPRWAETAFDSENPGFFLFGLDAFGRPHHTGTTSPDFSP